MVKYNRLPLIAAMVLGFGWALPAPARADNLLVQRVQNERGMNLPARGMSMARVEQHYGAPARKLSPRGGGRPHQPVINRWEYADFIVYFERNHVIHTVLNTPAGNNLHPTTAS